MNGWTRAHPRPAIVRGWTARHPAAAYFALTFAISWGGVLAAIGGPTGITGIKAQDNPRFPLVVLAMIAGPSLAGIGLTALVDGRQGLAAFGSRLVRWRIGAIWYAVSLLSAPLLAAIVAGALSLVSPEFRPAIAVAQDKIQLLAFAIVVGITAGVFEEIGWTGFVIPHLRQRHGVLQTGLIVGVLWSGWHVLVTAWGIGDRAGTVPLPVFIAVDGVAMLPAFRVLMVWVYDRTASLLIAVLMHASLTAATLVFAPQTTGAGLLTHGLTSAGVVWAALAVVALLNSRRGPVAPPARVEHVR